MPPAPAVSDSAAASPLHIQLPLHGSNPDADAVKHAAVPAPEKKRFGWWAKVIVNIFLVLASQAATILLGRFYYNQGGNSKWMATLLQSAGAPLLLIPLLLIMYRESRGGAAAAPRAPRPMLKLAGIYVVLGVLFSADSLMYSYGLLFLPVSTFSLICGTQLAFNAVFSYFLNGQKLTALIFNSVVLLTFSAALLGVTSGSDGSTSSADIPKDKYPAGFALTLAASALFSLLVSLVQLVFQKVQKTGALAVMLEMMLCTGTVSACVAVAGLLWSGEWRTLGGEMEGFKNGKVAYLMTLVWTAVTWQVCSLSATVLIVVVSALFANVISTVGLPLTPVLAVVLFGDRMDGVKVVALLIAVWGFLSYLYQHYLDDNRRRGDKTIIAAEQQAAAAEP